MACVFAVLAAVVAPTQAQTTIKLDGVWGNEAGCKYARDGDYGDDDMLLLKPESVESFVTGCSWLQVLTAEDGTQVATGLCGHEGEDYKTVDTFIVSTPESAPGKVRISQADGHMWGEVSKCP